MKFGKKWGMANRLQRLSGSSITEICFIGTIPYNLNASATGKGK
jgi:hypothetical protein